MNATCDLCEDRDQGATEEAAAVVAEMIAAQQAGDWARVAEAEEALREDFGVSLGYPFAAQK